MAAIKVFRHQDYELICSAKAIDNGKFEPSLVVSKHTWPSRPRVIAMQRGDFVSEDLAIEAAHAQGLQWILDYG